MKQRADYMKKLVPRQNGEVTSMKVSDVQISYHYHMTRMISSGSASVTDAAL